MNFHKCVLLTLLVTACAVDEDGKNPDCNAIHSACYDEVAQEPDGLARYYLAWNCDHELGECLATQCSPTVTCADLCVSAGFEQVCTAMCERTARLQQVQKTH